MTIKKLKNPRSKLYYDLKRHILSPEFEWNYLEDSVTPNDKDMVLWKEEVNKYIDKEFIIQNPHIYTHPFLLRSLPKSSTCWNQRVYPEMTNSTYMDQLSMICCDIFNINGFSNTDFNMMCRCSVNAVAPSDKRNIISVPHEDHEYPHKNMLIYLTDAGGSTFVEGEEFAPEEDDVIIFEGIHWHELPKKERRVVLVMTYI